MQSVKFGTQTPRAKKDAQPKEFELSEISDETLSWVSLVVNHLFQLNFIFPLFLDMVMYANVFKIKEKQKLTEIKN